jgi:hypothetical protein
MSTTTEKVIAMMTKTIGEMRVPAAIVPDHDPRVTVRGVRIPGKTVLAPDLDLRTRLTGRPAPEPTLSLP